VRRRRNRRGYLGLGVSVRTLERILAEIEVTKRRRLFD
jgi:hypothetical protein